MYFFITVHKKMVRKISNRSWSRLQISIVSSCHFIFFLSQVFWTH